MNSLLPWLDRLRHALTIRDNRRWLPLALALAFFGLEVPGASGAELRLAHGGKTDYVILYDPQASAPEMHAARELAQWLERVTGAVFPVQVADGRVPRRAILVGPGQAAEALFPAASLARLDAEGICIQTRGQRLLLAGGRPRGTLYAVSRFLQQQAGVRWWTPWAEDVPVRRTLEIPELRQQEKPAFEARDPFWYVAFDPEWAVRNFSNSQSARIPEGLGGAVRYRGFVHTFYPLVPPERHFADHPEWFSLVKGQRTTNHAQLCLTQPALRQHVVAEVKRWLRESPEATIVSVSQNDWHGACECDGCRAVDEAEGSPAGSLLAFVNFVAEQIEPEFPHVAIDTLAYQYTRKPPRTLRPRPNVIVRLCSIECNFREPLDHPSNASFADDIRGWSKICNRLYVWDYTTDFAHYVQPHPNWFVLGPNLRFFQQHHVVGMFEQGAYQSHGSEMAELRAWVLAQLLWNPRMDDRALIDEFLKGYYGTNAAPFIRQYLDLMHVSSKGFNLTCFSRTDTPFHDFGTLREAESLWQAATRAAARDPERARRVRVGHLPVRYVWLARWNQLRQQAQAQGAPWPLAESRRAVAEEWLQWTQGSPDAAWTKVTHLNESGLTPEKFVARILQE
jgi:hypothetical protein